MATVTVSYPTLEHVAQEARPYPAELLKDAETGLCLFSAAFMGHNDVIHFALEGVRTTCVDIDGDKLAALRALYPADWDFLCRDAWALAEEAAAEGTSWDVVSADTFRGNATERSLADLSVWTKIANQAVLATLEIGQTYTVPDGWKADTFQRNSEVFWLVLTRDES